MATNRDEQMRKQALHIVFAALRREGRSDLWLAQQLGISKSRLSNYKSGKNRVPGWIVERATTLVSEQIDHVYLVAPPEILIQRQDEWRGRKPAPKTGAKHATSEHNTSSSNRRVRRAQSAAPALDTSAAPQQPQRRQQRPQQPSTSVH